MFDGKERILSNVRYVPDLKRNLISLGSLNALGLEFHTQNGSLLVTKGEKIMMKGKKVNGLYSLIG